MRERELVSRTFDFKNSSGRETRALLREKEKERKFWKKVGKKLLAKNASANVSLGTIHLYVKRRHAKESRPRSMPCTYIGEGLKLLPDLIARVTTCARM